MITKVNPDKSPKQTVNLQTGMVLLRKNSEFYLIWCIIGPVKRSTVLILALGTSFVWVFRKDNKALDSYKG